jgi:MtaA/CmuA family methyltransferase
MNACWKSGGERETIKAVMNGRELILSHLTGRPVDRLPLMPITMMFAARQIEARYFDYCTDYRVLAEAQLCTAGKFGFDYVNTMSDPAREAADCGAPLQYFDEQPVALDETTAMLADKIQLKGLQQPDPLGGGRMHNGVLAVAHLREQVGGSLLVEGWVEGPMAEACDLRGINTLMLDFYDDPAFVRDLFAFVLEMELRFAREQVAAGADLIGIGDAAASLVGPEIYREFIWPFERQLVDGIHALGVPTRLHICGNTLAHLAGMGRLGCAVVDIDYPVPLREARTQMGSQQILIGNLNPVFGLRNGTPASITAALAACHHAAGARFIVGAGCEVPPDTPEENLRALCDFALTHQPEPRYDAA